MDIALGIAMAIAFSVVYCLIVIAWLSGRS